ncbi:MAG TPA: phosphoenolpyruvate synthase [Patescibacteria group bacterium]|nr:phosphoenolpyruvate synthase [Patescibacteria group bacterium]
MGAVFIKKLSEVSIKDVPEVGGKNASLGEMIQELTKKKGIPVPGGYVVTATAYRYFLKETGLDLFIKEALDGLNTKNLQDLASRGKKIREKIVATEFPEDIKEAIRKAHIEAEREYGKNADFAVRSSATAEDLPGASFAGEHETYLNVRGIGDAMLAIRKAMASLFNDRAISYRVDKGFDHFKVALSVGVQKMVRSDLACSGIMFSLDTETGFKDVVIINGSWGLGEMIVQGEVTPDEFIIFKPTLGQAMGQHPLKRLLGKKVYAPIIGKALGKKNRKMIYGKETPTKIIETSQKEFNNFVLTDREVLKLASWAVEIEKHYTAKAGKWTPMDMEWAKDGETGTLYIVQARPETIHSERDLTKIHEYERTQDGKELVKGASVGNKIASGKARVILDVADINKFQKGEILVTEITDPNWEPVMKIAAGIVTDKGGRTSHAAIVSRELGIPCIVGAEDATKKIKTGEIITVDTTGSDGLVLAGELKFKINEIDIKKLPVTKTKIMMNIATPDTAFEKSFLPNSGVGLAREEFIIASDIGIHPNALINYDKLPADLKAKIDKKTEGYDSKLQFYVDKLASGIAKICAAFYPHPVIVRLSDFKTNEYRSLLGGDLYEPKEENPMIGWRGASRYYSPEFIEAFRLEIRALRKVREEFGLLNCMVMVPFCRTADEGRKVIGIMEKNGLSPKKDKSLKFYVMCEIPANVVLADEFLDVFDGMSIGSNDLTQLTLGIDRDGNEKIRSIANENDESVKDLVSQVIKACKRRGKYIGICGQAPSDYPEFAQFLVREGIDSISLNPDTVIKNIMKIHEQEQKLRA